MKIINILSLFALVKNVQASFRIRNQLQFDDTSYCLAPRVTDQINSAVTLDLCTDASEQQFTSDGEGRLVNESSGGCLKSNERNQLRIASCEPEEGNLDSRLFYTTMDSALANFNTKGVKYVTVTVPDASDATFPALRLRENRDFTDISQKWTIEEISR